MRLLVFLPEEFQCKQKVQKKIREQVPTKSSRIKQLWHSTHKTTRLFDYMFHPLSFMESNFVVLFTSMEL